MTTFIRTIAIMVTLLVGSAIVACAETPEPYHPECAGFADGVVFIVGAHANQPAPDLTADLACRLQQTILHGDAIAIVANDGMPQVVLPATVYPVDGNNPSTVGNQVTQAYNTVVGAVQSAVPSADGSDLYASIVLAADTARTAQPPIGTVISLDAGLPDHGAVDMTIPGMTTVQPSELTAHLEEIGALTPQSFAGLTVEFWGIGYTALPQEAISAAQVAVVSGVWMAIIETGGGSASLVPYPWSGPGVETAHPTKTVEVLEPTRFEPSAGQTISLDGSMLSFTGYSTEFVSTTLAEATLQPIAVWLMASPDRFATIIGRTSSADLAISDELSVGRANSTKTMLVSLGVDPAQISADGVGYTADPPDRRADGSLDPVAASKNRVVSISLSEG